MMVSVETYLLRGKRRLDQAALLPGFQTGSRLVLFAAGGFLLSAAGLWDRMQPFAAGFVSSCGGIWATAAAAGSMLGYRTVWGQAGAQGAVWVLDALILGLAIRRWVHEDRQVELTTAGMALVTATVGLLFQMRLGDNSPVSVYLLRVVTAALSACLFSLLQKSKNRMAYWIAGALGILGLSGLSGLPWLHLGSLAAGAAASSAPLAAAALAGMGLEAAGLPCMTAGMCISCFLRLMPVRDRWRRMAAPCIGCTAAMVLGRYFDPGVWLGITLGGVVGTAFPWHWPALTHHSSTGALQVRMEQTAQLFQKLQRTLLEAPDPPIDRAGIAAVLRDNACSECSSRSTCTVKDRIDDRILSDPFAFGCRKNGRLLREVRRSQDHIRFLKGQKKRTSEYRNALIQQYGYLAGYLQLLADRLPLRERSGIARFHIQVSARSSGRELANGDRCLAFPGSFCCYYVLLCDGMGTGLGAAEEGYQAADLLKQMLIAGLPPQYALGSMNTHLALRGQAGAVTIDLAEIRLDTGSAALYKWGAAPSLIFRRNKAEKIGTVTPPPGISVSDAGESVVRLSLSRGEVLVLASDGIDVTDTSDLVDLAGNASPGELADYILQKYGGSGEDDATAAVVRLRPVNLAT